MDGLRYNDSFMVTADFDSYNAAQKMVASTWATPGLWWRKSIMNIAGAAWFSSDRTVKEYAADIWAVSSP